MAIQQPHFPLRRAINALRTLRSRVRELGQPGLCLWTDAGERATREIATAVGTAARANHSATKAVAADLREILPDGRVDAVEMHRLARHGVTLDGCSERSRHAMEAVQL